MHERNSILRSALAVAAGMPLGNLSRLRNKVALWQAKRRDSLGDVQHMKKPPVRQETASKPLNVKKQRFGLSARRGRRKSRRKSGRGRRRSRSRVRELYQPIIFPEIIFPPSSPFPTSDLISPPRGEKIATKSEGVIDPKPKGLDDESVPSEHNGPRKVGKADESSAFDDPGTTSIPSMDDLWGKSEIPVPTKSSVSLSSDLLEDLPSVRERRKWFEKRPTRQEPTTPTTANENEQPKSRRTVEKENWPTASFFRKFQSGQQGTTTGRTQFASPINEPTFPSGSTDTKNVSSKPDGQESTHGVEGPFALRKTGMGTARESHFGPIITSHMGSATASNMGPPTASNMGSTTTKNMGSHIGPTTSGKESTHGVERPYAFEPTMTSNMRPTSTPSNMGPTPTSNMGSHIGSTTFGKESTHGVERPHAFEPTMTSNMRPTSTCNLRPTTTSRTGGFCLRTKLSESNVNQRSGNRDSKFGSVSSSISPHSAPPNARTNLTRSNVMTNLSKMGLVEGQPTASRRSETYQASSSSSSAEERGPWLPQRSDSFYFGDSGQVRTKVPTPPMEKEFVPVARDNRSNDADRLSTCYPTVFSSPNSSLHNEPIVETNSAGEDQLYGMDEGLPNGPVRWVNSGDDSSDATQQMREKPIGSSDVNASHRPARFRHDSIRQTGGLMGRMNSNDDGSYAGHGSECSTLRSTMVVINYPQEQPIPQRHTVNLNINYDGFTQITEDIHAEEIQTENQMEAIEVEENHVGPIQAEENHVGPIQAEENHVEDMDAESRSD